MNQRACNIASAHKSSNVSRPHEFNKLEALTCCGNESWGQVTHGALMGDGPVVGGPKACGLGDLKQNQESNA